MLVTDQMQVQMHEHWCPSTEIRNAGRVERFPGALYVVRHVVRRISEERAGNMRPGILRWESQDLVIPVAISVRHWRHPDYVGAATPHVQPLIAASLVAAAHEGWHADEPTDFATLFSRSRVRTTNGVFRWRVTDVTIRLTRPIMREELVPHG